MSVSAEQHAAIAQALAAGQITVTDPTTGYHRPIVASCPADGQAAGIWRVVRGPAHAITALTMRCPSCGAEFTPAPDALVLR
jgi:hypothetical protein